MKNTLQSQGLRRIISSSLLVIAATCASLTIQAKDHEKDQQFTDESFIKHAAQANLMEVKAGQLASQQGQNSEVKQFGDRLVRDHGQAFNELKQLAQKQSVNLPVDLEEKHQKVLDKLQSQSGAQFDKEFARHMVKDHNKAIKKFEKAVSQAQNSEVKAYAQKNLPTLREHLEKAKEVAQAVGIDQADLASLEQEDETEAAGSPGSDTATGAASSGSEKKQGSGSSSGSERNESNKSDDSSKSSSGSKSDSSSQSDSSSKSNSTTP